MRNLKIVGGFVFAFWIIALILTFNSSWIWWAYLLISSVALILAAILLYQTEIKNLYYRAEKDVTKLKSRSTQKISYDEDEEYYDVLDNKKRRKKRKKRRPSNYLETTARERKKTSENHGSSDEIHRMSSIRNKEYLHTKINLLYNGEKQQLLFETIQNLKANNFFSSYYAGVTNDDLVNNFEEYEERNIFELYDNLIPNTYAKVLYDPKSDSNRIGIFLGTTGDNQDEMMLGFIALEDSYKADLLLKKYANIQVFPTILGGTYKRVYRNRSGEIKIIKDFINYDLTISLAFYNN
ncbi:phage holin family protein [Vagococcus carniphilus]|uniref:phage holin family protein n=1 Tax=Vagococcus carniphilus TaxID=218144 RepID=UPI002890BC1A|nr:phage holin family protein [Vagococcus carniphilus]MDT2849537.1 phage holin family protein [Vagococcus carniphilus]